MGLPEELWFKLHNVAYAARREKHPSKLLDLGRIANNCLEDWRAASAAEFSRLASMMLPEYAWPGPVETFPLTTAAIQQLCDLLQYIASLGLPAGNERSAIIFPHSF